MDEEARGLTGKSPKYGVSTTKASSALLAVMLSITITACSAPTPHPSPTATLPPAPTVSSTAVPSQQLSPSAVAWEYGEHGRQRLTSLATAKEGNAYQKLSTLKGTPGGLRDLAAQAEQRGVEAIASRVRNIDELDDKKSSPFRTDYELVLRAGTYRHVGAPLAIPEQGPVTIPHSEAFVKAISSLWLLPALEVGNTNVEDQLQNFRTYLHIARAVSLDAATIEHYEQGSALFRKTLDSLTRVVKTKNLSVNQLREVIAGLQELLASEIELQNVLDTEYFLALRRLESQKLDPETLTKEQDALAARLLAVRPLFEDPRAADRGFTATVEPPVGKLSQEWASKKDFLPALARSRLALTQLSAVKVLAALEAYNKEKKRYPDKIEELMPAYLSTVPTDWFSPEGRFVYSKTDNGFQLESVSAALPEAKAGRIAW